MPSLVRSLSICCSRLSRGKMMMALLSDSKHARIIGRVFPAAVGTTWTTPVPVLTCGMTATLKSYCKSILEQSAIYLKWLSEQCQIILLAEDMHYDILSVSHFTTAIRKCRLQRALSPPLHSGWRDVEQQWWGEGVKQWRGIVQPVLILFKRYFETLLLLSQRDNVKMNIFIGVSCLIGCKVVGVIWE